MAQASRLTQPRFSFRPNLGRETLQRPWVVISLITAIALVTAAVAMPLLLGGGGQESSPVGITRDEVGSTKATFGLGVPESDAFAFPQEPSTADVMVDGFYASGGDGEAFPVIAPQAGGTSRSVISTSTVSLEVDAVGDAMSQLRAIAESAGGYVESLSTSGGADPARGTATLRVPSDQFFNTIERIKELGTVTGEHVGSDDVTEQVIDLEARLRSEQAKEASFIELLSKAETVTDILTIERELSRVRTEIERLEAQLGSIERRVALASIHVSFNTPAEIFATPPSGSLGLETKDVEGRLAQIRSIVSAAGGEIDSVSTSVRDDSTQAYLALRVPADEFDQAVAKLEALGTLLSKEVRHPGPGESEQSEEANARIDLSLTTPEPFSFDWWRWVGAPLTVAASFGALSALAFGLYKLGTRRTNQP